MGFPFCTHLIISSSTESERVRPRTSGTAELGVDEVRSSTPESGNCKEGFIFGFGGSFVDRVFGMGGCMCEGISRRWWLAAKSRPREVLIST